MRNPGMQLSTFAITVPAGSCKLVLFLTVLSLPRSTKRDAIRMSVTLKVILHSASSNFQNVGDEVTCTMYGSTCQLAILHNGSLVPRPQLRERGSGDIRLIHRASLHWLLSGEYLSANHIAEKTICSATPEILGYSSTMTQHFFGA